MHRNFSHKANELVYVCFVNFNIFKRLFVTSQLFLFYPLYKRKVKGGGGASKDYFIVLLKGEGIFASITVSGKGREGVKNNKVNFETCLKKICDVIHNEIF